MKTYLISQDQVKQYLLVLIAVILAVFFLGYYTGTQLSTSVDSFNQAAASDTDKQSAANSSSPLITENSIEDKKKPDAKAENTKKAEQKELDKKKAEQKKTDKKKADKKKADKRRADKKKADRKKADEIKADKKKKQEQAAKKAEKDSLKKTTASPSSINNTTSVQTGQKQTSRVITPETTTGATAEEPVALAPGTSADDITGTKRYYSVQAGMFASKVNAASFIDRLAEKSFDAYVSDFVSTSGTVKYNVRVGRFEERDQARELLRKFQKSFSSPAYVVISN